MLVIGVSDFDTGRNCQVPKSGPFNRLLNGRKYVPTHSGKFVCRQFQWGALPPETNAA